MPIKTILAKKLREGDTFTQNNTPELVGRAVWDIDVIGATAYLTLTDRSSVMLHARATVEIDR